MKHKLPKITMKSYENSNQETSGIVLNQITLIWLHVLSKFKLESS